MAAHGLRAAAAPQQDHQQPRDDSDLVAAPGAETVHTTANHPWLTTDRGWVPAGDLRPGEPW